MASSFCNFLHFRLSSCLLGPNSFFSTFLLDFLNLFPSEVSSHKKPATAVNFSDQGTEVSPDM
jgi:hypothetical protein